MSTTLDVRLKSRYRSEIAPALKTQFGFKNPMQIPTLVKIVVNMGVGEAARDSKLIEGAVRDLASHVNQSHNLSCVKVSQSALT
jgi:large subunit ribosomal protein L5